MTLSNVLNNFLTENLDELKNQGLYNEIDPVEGANGAKIQVRGLELINLSSNNYLGLATNLRAKTNCQRCSGQVRCGSRSRSHD